MTTPRPHRTSSPGGHRRGSKARPADELIGTAVAFELGTRADCCGAGALFRVLVPVAGTRPAELLMCGHHFRTKRPALDRAHASVFDAAGRIVG